MKDKLKEIGLVVSKSIYTNLSRAELIEQAVMKQEGILSETGVFNMITTPYTGRLAENRFIVDTPTVHDTIAWGAHNHPVTADVYDKLRKEIVSHLSAQTLYIYDGYAGADASYTMPTRIINESPAQTLFMKNMLIEAVETHQAFIAELTILVASSYQCDITIADKNYDALILLNLDKKEILVCGTKYSGEIKKSVFSYMNYILPFKDVLPMHCSANVGDNDDVALFFGLSGTGKTTLSNDPKRHIIGDDEHAWSPNGIFNIEGGIYAKCYQLKQENEPQIWSAMRFGAISENIVLDQRTRRYDFDDKRLTENSRVAFPIEFIANSVIPSVTTHPKVVIFLTADAFGVLPPVAKLNLNQAKYHFISGYTSKLAGTEQGITEPTATFSTCFGAPFFPLPATVYADMLGEKMLKHNTKVFLVNTGWTGGMYGEGNRISLQITRDIITAIMQGALDDSEYRHDEIFNLDVPVTCPNVPTLVLNPVASWKDVAKYQITAQKLADLFVENFAQYDNIASEIIEAGPRQAVDG